MRHELTDSRTAVVHGSRAGVGARLAVGSEVIVHDLVRRVTFSQHPAGCAARSCALRRRSGRATIRCRQGRFPPRYFLVVPRIPQPCGQPEHRELCAAVGPNVGDEVTSGAGKNYCCRSSLVVLSGRSFPRSLPGRDVNPLRLLSGILSPSGLSF